MSPAGRHLNVADKLVLAAFSLEQSGRRPFSAEDLVIAAWRSFPDAFGLAGHLDSDGRPAYPDSNRVFAEIMGSKPIRRKGYLVKVGSKMYQLTEAGHEVAISLKSAQAGPAVRKASLARETEIELRRLLGSKAAEKTRSGRGVEITFHDACSYWGISPRSSAIEFEGRIANLTRIVEAARRSAGGEEVSFDHNSPKFGRDDLSLLISIHEHLLDRFAAEIKTIRERTDER